MTVWVVEAHDYDESGVEAIFSTEALADEFVAKWNQKAAYQDEELTVTARQLDERVGDEAVAITVAMVTTETGAVQHVGSTAHWRSNLEPYPVNTSTAGARMCSGRSSEGREAALRLAEAARQEWLKQGWLGTNHVRP